MTINLFPDLQPKVSKILPITYIPGPSMEH